MEEGGLWGSLILPGSPAWSREVGLTPPRDHLPHPRPIPRETPPGAPAGPPLSSSLPSPTLTWHLREERRCSKRPPRSWGPDFHSRARRPAPQDPRTQPAASAASTQHPGGCGKPETVPPRGPRHVTSPPRPHSNRDLNTFPALGAVMVKSTRSSYFEAPKRQDPLSRLSTKSFLSVPHGITELEGPESRTAAPHPPHADPGPGRKPRGRCEGKEGAPGPGGGTCGGRSQWRPLPHSQNLGGRESKESKHSGTQSATQGFQEPPTKVSS